MDTQRAATLAGETFGRMAGKTDAEKLKELIALYELAHFDGKLEGIGIRRQSVIHAVGDRQEPTPSGT